MTSRRVSAEGPWRNCPYGDCPFQGTEAEVDDHVGYMTTFDDPDHRVDKLREAR